MTRAFPLLLLHACDRPDIDRPPTDTAPVVDTAADTGGHPDDTGLPDTGLPDTGAPDDTSEPDPREAPLVTPAGLLLGGSAGLGIGGAGTLAVGGDPDEDGADDLIVVAGGAGWLVAGADATGAHGPLDALARARLSGSAELPLATVAGGMVDLTGDATVDVLVTGSSASAGAGLLLDGDAAEGDVSLVRDATARFQGAPASDATRWALAGDLDGDGVAEVVTGQPLDTWTSGWASAWYSGGVAVFAGDGFVGARTAAEADAVVHGAAAYDYLGSALAVGDLTGDGYADVIAGAPGHDGGATGAGAVYVLAGGAALGWASERADGAAVVAVVGSQPGTELGAAPIPTPADLDGDGAADLVLGAPERGAVWAFVGLAGVPGSVPVDAAPATWTGLPGAFGTALGVGDLDADGIAELAIGAAGDDTVAPDAGAVFLFGGIGPGAWSSADADASLYGRAPGDALGAGLAAGGDLDGDGAGDLLVGAPGVDEGAAEAGAVYALRGRAP